MTHFKRDAAPHNLVGGPAEKMEMGDVCRVRYIGPLSDDIREPIEYDAVMTDGAYLGSPAGDRKDSDILLILGRPNRGQLVTADFYEVIKVYGEGDCFAV